MGWTPEQYKEAKKRLEGNFRVRPPVTATSKVAPIAPIACRFTITGFEDYDSREFVYNGLPVGKPRMTQRDKWQKRPRVMAYRAFADGLRAAAQAAGGPLPQNPDVVQIEAYMPMPQSWSEKKKLSLDGKPCRQAPDRDNLEKSVGDALFKEDSCIWGGSGLKLWCRAGSERIHVTVLYAKPN